MAFSDTMFCISRNRQIQSRSSSWFNICVSVYARTVVLDSISENLVQMAAEPDQTRLNSLKLCACGISICACFYQIMRGLADSYQCLLYTQHHNILAEMTTSSSLPQDQFPQQHYQVPVKCEVNLEMGHGLAKGENKTLTDSQRRDMELITFVSESFAFCIYISLLYLLV